MTIGQLPSLSCTRRASVVLRGLTEAAGSSPRPDRSGCRLRGWPACIGVDYGPGGAATRLTVARSPRTVSGTRAKGTGCPQERPPSRSTTLARPHPSSRRPWSRRCGSGSSAVPRHAVQGCGPHMVTYRIHCVVVSEMEGGKPVGVISDIDLAVATSAGARDGTAGQLAVTESVIVAADDSPRPRLSAHGRAPGQPPRCHPAAQRPSGRSALGAGPGWRPRLGRHGVGNSGCRCPLEVREWPVAPQPLRPTR
jgi:hypothetical protein